MGCDVAGHSGNMFTFVALVCALLTRYQDKMALEPRRSRSHQAGDVWHRFTLRNEQAHDPEDRRLCSPQHSVPEVIKRFMERGYTRLTGPIPHQRRLLKEFLEEMRFMLPGGHTHSIDTDVRHPVVNTGIAGLLEDRHDHGRCAKLVGNTCNNDIVYSSNVCTSKLYESLHKERLARKAERRVLFIPDLTSATALVLASAIAQRSTIPLRNMMHRYLTRECIFSVVTTWGFFLEFHIPYYAMRIGRHVRDHRVIAGKRLRKSEVLPLQHESKDPDELFYYESQISSLYWGPDESFWTEIFLVETFFGSELDFEKYLDPKVDSFTKLTLRVDPPTITSDPNMTLDPREYWLRQLDVRLSQAVHEYTALIGTFSKRMEAYVRTPEFTSDRSGHTQTLSDVLETIQTITDCISSTVDAWEVFRRHQITFFVIDEHSKNAQYKHAYPRLLNNIVGHMAELERLRSILLTQRAKFKTRIENFHTVHSLSQTETAIAQGENIRILTQMTVYVAFPLLFTAAIFSMDFVKPKSEDLAWGLFFTVVVVISMLNGTIAWLLHKSLIQKTFAQLFAFVGVLLKKLVALVERKFDKLAEWW